MRVTRTTILNDADPETYGIRNFGILHLPLKDRQTFGMGVRSDNIELFGFALGEVAHERNGIFNIHIASIIII